MSDGCEISIPEWPLDEDVYVAQSVGFVKQDLESKVYRMHKAM